MQLQPPPAAYSPSMRETAVGSCAPSTSLQAVFGAQRPGSSDGWRAGGQPESGRPLRGSDVARARRSWDGPSAAGSPASLVACWPAPSGLDGHSDRGARCDSRPTPVAPDVEFNTAPPPIPASWSADRTGRPAPGATSSLARRVRCHDGDRIRHSLAGDSILGASLRACGRTRRPLATSARFAAFGHTGDRHRVARS